MLTLSFGNKNKMKQESLNKMNQPSERWIILVKVERLEDEGDKKTKGASNKVRTRTPSSTMWSFSTPSYVVTMLLLEIDESWEIWRDCKWERSKGA